MASKDAFSADEWDAIAKAPFFVSMAIGVADPSGPFGMIKEGAALGKAVKAAADGHAGELAKAVAAELREHRPSRDEMAGGAKSTDEASKAAIEKLRGIAEIVNTKGGGTDGQAYKAWLAELADHVAEAGKEGGFLGIGGESVSEDEKTAIAGVRSALGL